MNALSVKQEHYGALGGSPDPLFKDVSPKKPSFIILHLTKERKASTAEKSKFHESISSFYQPLISENKHPSTFFSKRVIDF